MTKENKTKPANWVCKDCAEKRGAEIMSSADPMKVDGFCGICDGFKQVVQAKGYGEDRYKNLELTCK